MHGSDGKRRRSEQRSEFWLRPESLLELRREQDQGAFGEQRQSGVVAEA
jgi:hypothetical protein